MFISLCNFINHDCHAKYCLVQTLNGPFSRKARFYQIRSKLRIACASLSLCVIFFPFPTSLTEMSRISKDPRYKQQAAELRAIVLLQVQFLRLGFQLRPCDAT